MNKYKSFKINSKMNVKKSKDPFFHIIIDNFFDDMQLKELLKDWPSSNDYKWNNTRKKINGEINLLENGIKSINDPSKLPLNWRNFFNFTHYDGNFINCINNLFEKENLIPDQTYNWSGLRENLPNSYQLIHSDALVHPIKGWKKYLTIMIYFDDAKIIRKGNLELWDKEMKSSKVSIKPLFNRLVIFECTPTSYHGVPQCDYLRRAFTMSFIDPTVKNNFLRNKAKFVARPTDSKKVSEQGLLRTKIN